MSVSRIGAIGLAMLLAGCGGEKESPDNRVEAQPKKEKPPHCFFKEAELDSFKLAQDGNELVVTGRAYRSDGRYKAFLQDPKVEDGTAILYPTIGVNDTGFSAPENWWDIEKRLPANGIRAVEVRCGARLVKKMPAPASRNQDND